MLASGCRETPSGVLNGNDDSDKLPPNEACLVQTNVVSRPSASVVEGTKVDSELSASFKVKILALLVGYRAEAQESF